MTALAIDIIPCLKDNYAYLVHGGGLCAVIDPAEAGPVEAALAARGLGLSHILNTHHHWDHTSGNEALKARFGAQVVGPQKERERIPGIDIGVDETGWQFGDVAVQVLEVPAHTAGAVAYRFGTAVFTGDTLFAMGCGRLFEGTAAMMAASLAKLAALPDGTAVYCGHEYTRNNGRFALTLEPGNRDLAERMEGLGKVTMPSSIGLEKKTNPFLRCFSAEIRSKLGMETADDVAVFAEIRRRKDSF